tara:strand:+ start:201 stop:551 length:351 start_codon:yes stop_codon:yes gene_type:complete
MAFKMKGSPFQRNFGIGGSPLTSNGGIYNEPTKKESRKVKKAEKKFKKAEKWADKGNIKKAEKKWKKGMKKFKQGIEADPQLDTFPGTREELTNMSKAQGKAFDALDKAGSDLYNL